MENNVFFAMVLVFGKHNMLHFIQKAYVLFLEFEVFGK